MAEQDELIREAAAQLLKQKWGAKTQLAKFLGTTPPRISQMLAADEEGRLPADALVEIVRITKQDAFSPILQAALPARRPDSVSDTARKLIGFTKSLESVAQALPDRLGFQLDGRVLLARLNEMLDSKGKRNLPADLLIDIVSITGIDPFSSLLQRELKRATGKNGT